MKLIIVIIRPERLHDVKVAATEAGAKGMTVIEVKGRGDQKGIKLQSRGGSYEVEFIQKVKIEMAVNDEVVPAVIEAVVRSARTERGPGDGKIFVLPIEEVVRIRTGQKNCDCL
ncbi:MAG: P-II family nitrogen regulator [Candidatus Lokiarchaeota archaeon]|nr:P-II family nitrogen regulator [Candidatus Lokiarchaeota archaeon]